MHEPFSGEHALPRSSDSLPLRIAPLEVIDLPKVTAHIAEAMDRGRYHGPTDPITYLTETACAVALDGTLYATPAGVLCFAIAPQKLYPRAVVDIGHYSGIDPISFEVVHLEKDIGGTLFEQIDRVESYIWANTHHGMTVSPEHARRIELHEYPRVVIRELAVNMIAHRDYTNILSTARVQLFRNRIEWISPGGLPPGVTVDNLLTAQASRNPIIVSVLYQRGYVEAFGQGLDTVVAVLKRESMQLPKFEDDGSFFRVTVAGRPQELFLHETSGVRLSDRQRRIMALVRQRGEVTPRDISELFDDRVTPRSIQRDLKDLMDLDLLVAEGKGRAVRYRLYDHVS